MPTQYTTLLGLAKPATGELSGTWGATVNSYITEYLDAAVAGAQVISGSQTAVTLSTTNGSSLVQAAASASGSAQYAIIRCTGNPAGLLTITAPSTSKAYLIVNATSTNQSVKIVGSGPTTGITVAANRVALVAWSGSDFVLVATTDVSQLSGVLPVANGGTGISSFGTGVATALGQNVTGSGGIVLATSPTIATSLAVNGDTSLDGALVVNDSGADKDTRIEGDTDPNLFFVDASTDRVGIGTNAPSAKVQTVATSPTRGITGIFAATGSTGAQLQITQSTIEDWVIGQPAGVSAFVVWSGRNSGSDGTEHFRITSAGLVGIGTNAPANRLHVSSGATDEVARFEGTGSPYISLYDSGVREFFIQTTGGGINVYGETNKPMLFYTNSVGRFQIAADGAQSSVIPAGSTLYPQFACRAWINFDGTAVTNPASMTGVRGSGNVSSVLDNGAGDYTINFTTAMPDTNFATLVSAQSETNGTNILFPTLYYSGTPVTTSSVRVQMFPSGGGGGGAADSDFMNVAVFR